MIKSFRKLTTLGLAMAAFYKGLTCGEFTLVGISILLILEVLDIYE